jgi:hypothetical protein
MKSTSRAHLSVAPESVRKRLANAEEKFRRNDHRTISEAEFVEACNRTAAEFDLPDYARTSGAQVHAFRELLRQMAPSAIGRSGHSTEMTPAEAVFVALQLASQKVLNPDYQVPPNRWVESIRHDHQHGQQDDRQQGHQGAQAKAPSTAVHLQRRHERDV